MKQFQPATEAQMIERGGKLEVRDSPPKKLRSWQICDAFCDNADVQEFLNANLDIRKAYLDWFERERLHKQPMCR